MRASRIKAGLYGGLLLGLVILSPWADCLAQEQGQTQASFLEALLAFSILLVLGVGIFFALKIHSLLKGGELSSVWVVSGIAFSVLLASGFLEFLESLGVLSGFSPVVLIFQLLGFFLLVLGVALLKKKLS